MVNNYTYGFIGNCTSGALISEDCSIEWLCLPFFDSPSLFAQILDKDKGGYFKIIGVNTIQIKQAYIKNTPILKTTIETKDGIFEVRDYMPRFVNETGDYYCPSEIHRDIIVISGKPKIKVELVPMPNYALGQANVEIFPEYIKITSTEGEYNSFYLYTSLPKESILKGDPIELSDQSDFLALAYHEKISAIDREYFYIDYEKTKTYWLSWVQQTKIPKKHRDLVARSAITLKLLTFQKTGAVIAAPTTSLPEIIGGDRNWDYRYCWVRDGSMIIDLFIRLGHVRSSTKYLHYILDRMLLKHHNILVMYGINGERDLTESTLDHLAGYENSRPVRIGNGAFTQQQNDLYGELVETIYTFLSMSQNSKRVVDEELWTVVRSLINEVNYYWSKPDSGIWEQRGPQQHYVHSKLMSWVAADRTAKIAKLINKKRYEEKCRILADKIKLEILKEGWNEEVGAFTMSYGSSNLDAANLLMLHYGFLKADDEKMIKTVQRSYEQLVKNNYTMRYTHDDGLGLPQNAFIVCCFWMINALYLIGEQDKAREMFDHIIKLMNPHGLFAEDVDINTGRLTGNFPQGYSHLAFIQTVLLLETDYDWTDSMPITLRQNID